MTTPSSHASTSAAESDSGKSTAGGQGETLQQPVRVGLFASCLVDLYRPNVGFASIKLLEQAGCEVSVPDVQTCCGQPAYNSGDTSSSIEMARNTIEAFEKFDYIVVPSGSCAGMLRDHYPPLFNEDTEWQSRASDFAQRVYELTSFLTDIMGCCEVSTEFNHAVTYHDSCSGLRELGIKQQPRALLASVAGLQLNEMEDTDVCCGFGGTFCVKYPDISERMVSDKAALAAQTGAAVVLGGDLGCLLNISGRLSRLNYPLRTFHVAEVLAGMADGPGIGESSAAATSESSSDASREN